MPLHVDVKRKLTTRSDRVKSLDLHPNEPWLLVSLYNGSIHVWDIEQQQLIKTVDVCSMPVRTGKFISRKFWMVFGSDDMMIRVYNYNTTERIKEFEAHSDYIRCILVHPTHPYIITSSDDMSIKMWDWDNNWKMTMNFEGHIHYVMNLALNPKDNNTFASASLDKTIKVWNIGSSRPNFSLEGHSKGVNFVDYYSLGDKPYLASGSDDRTIMIWDFQTKTCVQTLTAHGHNISFVVFHPQLPLLMSGSEDGTVNLWHSGTYRLETTLSYGMERAWCAITGKGTYQNMVAIGYDEGAIVVSLGKDEPSISMDKSGKIICAQHCEIYQANIKSILSTMDETSIKDGERIATNLKELGTCDIYPQSIQHNNNGRFVVICGDGEYVIHTAMALRNKSFGQAFEFAWSPSDANSYVIRDDSRQIKLFKNFKEFKSLRTDFSIDSIFPGTLIGIRGAQGLSFYDWNDLSFIRRIEIIPDNIYWNESGTLVALCTKDEFFILRYNSELVNQNLLNKGQQSSANDEEEVENAFELIENGQIQDSVTKGYWYGEAFIFQNNSHKLRYFIGGEVITLTQYEKGLNLIGYMPKDNRLFLVDNKLQLISYTLYQSILEYESAIIEENFELASSILPTIPVGELKNVAIFLEKRGHNELALQVTNDPEHKFDLSLGLGDLNLAYALLQGEVQQDGLEEKWKHLAELACKKSDFELAQNCLLMCKDFPSLLVLASCSGNVAMMQQISQVADQNKFKNLHFLASFLLGNLDDCIEALLKSERYAEAAFFSRAYIPSRCSEVVEKWKKFLSNDSKNQSDIKIMESIADPVGYPDLFPDFQKSLKAEKCNKIGIMNRLKMSPVNYPKVDRGWENDIDNEDILSSAIPEPIQSQMEPMVPKVMAMTKPEEARIKKLSESSAVKQSTSSSTSAVDLIEEEESVKNIDIMMTRMEVKETKNTLETTNTLSNPVATSNVSSLKSSSDKEQNVPQEESEEDESSNGTEEGDEKANDNKGGDLNVDFNWSEDEDENYE